MDYRITLYQLRHLSSPQVWLLSMTDLSLTSLSSVVSGLFHSPIFSLKSHLFGNLERKSGVSLFDVPLSVFLRVSTRGREVTFFWTLDSFGIFYPSNILLLICLVPAALRRMSLWRIKRHSLCKWLEEQSLCGCASERRLTSTF